MGNLNVRKPFSQQLHDVHNGPAILTLIHNHLGQGWVHNPDKFGPDIQNISTRAFAEVEVKHAWKSGAIFPFATVNLPERKGKWKDLDIMFFLLNHSLDHAIKLLPLYLREEFLKEVPNKFVVKHERFFQVPLEFCEVIDLNSPKRGPRY